MAEEPLISIGDDDATAREGTIDLARSMKFAVEGKVAICAHSSPPAPPRFDRRLPRYRCATVLAFAPMLGWTVPAAGQSLTNEAAASSASWTLPLRQSAQANSADGQPEQSTPGAAPDVSATAPRPGALQAGPSAPSGNDLASQITNPVTSLWLIQFEFNNYKLEENALSPVSGKWVNNLHFQPVLPVNLTSDLSLITRPVITAYQSVPHPTATGRIERTTAFGDTILAQMLSPAHTEPWIVAAGPTWIFPTAGSDFTGQGKWQLGPAVGGGYLNSRFMAAAFVQQWWSIAGDNNRPSTSQMNILPMVYAFFGDGWSVGYSGSINVDWKAREGERWTVPVGLSLGRVVRFGILPVQIRLGGQYMAIRPEGGPRWNFQLQFTPVIPRLIRNPIF